MFDSWLLKGLINKNGLETKSARLRLSTFKKLPVMCDMPRMKYFLGGRSL